MTEDRRIGGGACRGVPELPLGFKSGYQKIISTLSERKAINLRHHDVIEAMYKEGYATSEIAEAVELSTRQIRKVLNQRGVELRGRRRAGGYCIDEGFFKQWTASMAYVVGFIFADGHISGNSIIISQASRGILDEINNVMESDCRIHKNEDGVFLLSIHRKEMVGDLKRIGIEDDFPQVPAEYMSDFIRGVFDGDGWVDKRGYVANITNANKNFARKLHRIFNEQEFSGRITEQDNAYRVWVSGKDDVRRFGEWIYGGELSGLYLERKRRRFPRRQKEKTSA